MLNRGAPNFGTTTTQLNSLLRALQNGQIDFNGYVKPLNEITNIISGDTTKLTVSITNGTATLTVLESDDTTRIRRLLEDILLTLQDLSNKLGDK